MKKCAIIYKYVSDVTHEPLVFLMFEIRNSNFWIFIGAEDFVVESIYNCQSKFLSVGLLPTLRIIETEY